MEEMRLAWQDNHDTDRRFGRTYFIVHGSITLRRLIEVLHADAAAVEDDRVATSLALIRILQDMAAIHWTRVT